MPWPMTAVDKILNAGNIEQQAAVLRAIANHPALAAAYKLAGIDSLKEQATTKYVCEQSTRMLGLLAAVKTPMVKQRETNIMQSRWCLRLQPHHPTGYQLLLANATAILSLRLHC